MSSEKYQKQAQRWFSQAKMDIGAAQNSLHTKNFEWACFQAQQAGEKILKAVWLYYQHDPWGHSIFKLIKDFPEQEIYRKLLSQLEKEAQLLDKLYIPTRYPNGLPDLMPFEAYNEQDAAQALEAVNKIFTQIESHLNF